jgi:hypothetical protein
MHYLIKNAAMAAFVSPMRKNYERSVKNDASVSSGKVSKCIGYSG